MKKAFFILFSIALLSSCAERQTTKQRITVSIPPQKHFIEAIAGDDFEVNVMVPSGASPATYEPTPKQMVNLQSSPLYFRIGHIGFEKAWMGNIDKNHPEMKIIDLSKGLNLIESGRHQHGDHVHIGVDPHIWMSPKMVEQFSQSILSALVELRPERAETYKKNHALFIAKTEKLDKQIRQETSKISNKNFLIFHPVLRYYARDYGLNQIPLEIDGKEPGADHMKSIIDLAKKDHIQKIFIQKEFDQKHAETLSRQIDAEIIVIDPLSEQWEESLMEITQNLIR